MSFSICSWSKYNAMFTWLIERGQGGLVRWDAQYCVGQCDYVHAAQQDRLIRTWANLV